MDTATICGTLHRAIEAKDIEKLLTLYDDNAELKVIDRIHTPSNPMHLKGKAAISNHLRDVFSRDMTHQIVDEIVGEESMAFSEDCEYPDGTHVFTNATVDLRDGKIIHEVEVQAWDELS